MRKLLPAALLCATLLPGCVLAIGNGTDDKKFSHRLDEIDRRLTSIEQRLDMHGGPGMQGQMMFEERERRPMHEDNEEHEDHEGHN